ncbi:hypothetical protein AMTRI_Chr11g156740 [Amborella trichopoda]|uniref:Uncharacterized protein n=1 Tax=Amborella trichopoda TaxID=13333 RepID=W1P8R6_AMBTC|nr:uncharacterized protein LOC18432222 [Amborella trichopoda]ERN04069.1 hypothetical protein AMTR_s00209p00027350 [Amborella trichopoda]|eukprot:XP_006842394.1 uncharacterized protein LOC18432222 [Amborella trichopoda]
MDREPEEMQFLGCFGIYKEAFKIILSWRKIFTRITLALILPLSFIFLAHNFVTDRIFSSIHRNEQALDTHPQSKHKIIDKITSEWISLFLFKAVYLVCVLIFSLLSTSAIVYTVACIYTAKEINFRKVLSVVPKVWKRLMVTFLWNFVILLCYNTVCIVIIVCFAFLVLQSDDSILSVLFWIVLIGFYLVGLAYISVVWHLASVVSVLEDKYGISAMQKSRNLIKGKIWVAAFIFVKLSAIYIGIQVLFGAIVLKGGGWVWRLGFGVLMVGVLCLLILLGLVVQTVVYFVCKSYHHESIDKSCLSDHLEVYLGEYVPLKGSAVQLEQLYV